MAKKKIDVERLRGVVNMGREAEESMAESMIISVHVDPACPRWLALAVKAALVPERDAVVNVSSLVSYPTAADVDVTRRLYRMLQMLGVELVDHIIVSDGDFVSMRDSGHFATF